MNTRTDAEGNKVLFLEEVQSDWGQKGKKEGFNLTKEQVQENYENAVSEEKRLEKQLNEKYGDKLWSTGNIRDFLSKDEYSAYEKAVTDVAKWGSRSGKDYSTGNPLAPFVTDTNAWTKLGLKVALKEAVAQGIDKIAWTTGEQQNERYDLSKSVDYVQSIVTGKQIGRAHV